MGSTTHRWGIHFYAQFNKSAAKKYSKSKSTFEAVAGAAALAALQWAELKMGVSSALTGVFNVWIVNHVREKGTPMFKKLKSCVRQHKGFQVGAHVTWWFSINTFQYQCING